MRIADHGAPGSLVLPRVLVVGSHLSMLRACEEALGGGALVRTCLGARAAGRAVWTWDPTAIVLDHDPPALDAAELLRVWREAGRFVPDVVLFSRAPAENLATLARRHPGARVVARPETAGSLARAVRDAHRASEARRVASRAASGSRPRPRPPRPTD